jgi:hypothetical protein
MSQIEHKQCFGKMFPDDLHLRSNVPNEGKVFAVRIESVGGIMPARSDRTIDMNIEEWDDCQQCPEFDSCYKLCVGKVTLESVVATQ